jgi:REP element-mobilizing transposase RayT
MAQGIALRPRRQIDIQHPENSRRAQHAAHQWRNTMAQSLAKVLIHLVYSTKCRAPLLPQTPYAGLHAYAQGILKSLKCHLIEMNNVADHVHILFDLHRTESLSDVVMHLKKRTSRRLKAQSPDFADFDWQEGYGAFSVGRSQREEVVAYIRNQQQHRPRVSFQDEFRRFLEVYEIEYDERYVWD